MALGLLRRKGGKMTTANVTGTIAELQGEIAARQAAIAAMRSEREAAQALLDEHLLGGRLDGTDRSVDVGQLRTRVRDIDRKLDEEAAALAEDRRVLAGLERPLLEAEYIVTQAAYTEAMAREAAMRTSAHDAFKSWLVAARAFRQWHSDARTAASARNSIARALGEPEAPSPRDQLLPGSLTYVSDAVLRGTERQARIYAMAIEEYDRRLENDRRLHEGGG